MYSILQDNSPSQKNPPQMSLYMVNLVDIPLTLQLNPERLDFGKG